MTLQYGIDNYTSSTDFVASFMTWYIHLCFGIVIIKVFYILVIFWDLIIFVSRINDNFYNLLCCNLQGQEGTHLCFKRADCSLDGWH